MPITFTLYISDFFLIYRELDLVTAKYMDKLKDDAFETPIDIWMVSQLTLLSSTSETPLSAQTNEIPRYQ